MQHEKLFPLLLLFMSATAWADWVKINGSADTSPEKFIDTKAIRQTGPMNTMRRVWEISNLVKGNSDKIFSIKTHMEYDCKDRRIRVLEEGHFSEHWAQGENLTMPGHDVKPNNWSGIGKGTASEAIFNRVCPHDESDSSTD